MGPASHPPWDLHPALPSLAGRLKQPLGVTAERATQLRPTPGDSTPTPTIHPRDVRPASLGASHSRQPADEGLASRPANRTRQPAGAPPLAVPPHARGLV